jgi:outer membrane protein assembly factor BamB
MKKICLCFCVLGIALVASCELFSGIGSEKKTAAEEPAYKAKIVWEAKTDIARLHIVASGRDCVYVFEEGGPGLFDDFILTKLDARTGKRRWSSIPVPPLDFFVTAIEHGEYVYIWERNFLYSFSQETGALSALVKFELDDCINIASVPLVHGDTLYFGFGLSSTGNCYLVRFDLTLIDHNRENAETPQVVTPEIIWQSREIRPVCSAVIEKNIIYFETFEGYQGKRTELAGVNIDTGEEIWYTLIDYDDGSSMYGLYAKNDILYFVSSGISAYDLRTKQPLYTKGFSHYTPLADDYRPAGHRGFVLYNNKLYYTNDGTKTSETDLDIKNIYCVDAKTGSRVWGAIAPWSESLGTNPVIAHKRMYVPQYTGLRVYEPEKGKLLGVDSSFCGIGFATNVLYNDYMITVKADRNTGVANVVAIDTNW